MAIFKNIPEEWARLDWCILINGSISLYYKKEILREDINWFLNNKYIKYEFDCSDWLTEEDFHSAVKSGFRFPGYYGENLSAFNDCLRGMEVPDDGGVIIVLLRYDAFYQRSFDNSQEILDIIEVNSRRFLLSGKRLITLVQSNDPKILFSSVGACPVIWNSKEWLKSNRGL